MKHIFFVCLVSSYFLGEVGGRAATAAAPAYPGAQRSTGQSRRALGLIVISQMIFLRGWKYCARNSGREVNKEC